MIPIVDGDIIDLMERNYFDTIMHGCNCFHIMGGGIAGGLAKKYPEVLEVDKKTQYGARDKLGRYSRVQLMSLPKEVLNCYTQYDLSSGSDVFEYEALNKIVTKLITDYQWVGNPGRIGCPMIGAGLARGDWGRIINILNRMNSESGEMPLILVDYRYQLFNSLVNRTMNNRVGWKFTFTFKRISMLQPNPYSKQGIVIADTDHGLYALIRLASHPDMVEKMFFSIQDLEEIEFTMVEKQSLEGMMTSRFYELRSIAHNLVRN